MLGRARAKATFAVRLVVPEGLTALSNGAEVGRESLGDGRVRVTLRRHDGDVDLPRRLRRRTRSRSPTRSTCCGAPLRVACPPGKKHLTPYALDVAEACLRWFTDYYAIPYPGGKIDLVAIPDFAFGAMENNGCITFREVLLLVDPAAADAARAASCSPTSSTTRSPTCGSGTS